MIHPNLFRAPALIRPTFICIAVALATWDGWRWYISRMAGHPEEGLTLLLTLAFLGGLGLVRREQSSPPRAMPLWTLAGLLLVYAGFRLQAPAIVAAAMAIAVTLFALDVALFKSRPPLAFWGLVALALPVLPSLQFTLGYPMRIVSAAMTVGVLRLQGLAIERHGTFLRWQGEMVQFDAPCSGINMLWAALMLTLMGAVVLRIGAARLLLALVVCVLATVLANVLRAASLFYVETGQIAGTPAWFHEGAGLAAFAFLAAGVLWTLLQLQPREARP